MCVHFCGGSSVEAHTDTSTPVKTAKFHNKRLPMTREELRTPTWLYDSICLRKSTLTPCMYCVLSHVESRTNKRPRVKLYFRTPEFVFNKKSGKFALITWLRPPSFFLSKKVDKDPKNTGLISKMFPHARKYAILEQYYNMLIFKLLLFMV